MFHLTHNSMGTLVNEEEASGINDKHSNDSSPARKIPEGETGVTGSASEGEGSVPLIQPHWEGAVSWDIE
ncbi:hypothetical protein CEXT_242061 [Caerostris extrusa]|uniref:Uncharacterized protein n=1 Tax=Caerostris extrusa TaxID=172846 RepID=A0AAV4WKC5_CAEEX|nr:hypothetical protein CEXT_242061 [Caerostris extrusa]